MKASCFRYLAVALAAVAVGGCGDNGDPRAAERPVPVRVARATRVERPDAISASGVVVSPGNPASIGFMVSGRLARVGPREGDLVKKGDVLAEIDPVDYRLAVEAAEAQLAAARAVLAKAQGPARRELLEQARVGYERAADEYRRMKQLFDAKSLAPNDFEKVRAAYEVAAQQYEQAKNGAQPEERAQAEAGVDQAEAALRIARQRLADTVLRAPVAGYVAMRGAEPGEMVGPARPIFQIVTLDPVEVNVGIPENDVHRVQIGQVARIRIPAIPDAVFEGRVRAINVAADPATRTYMARVRTDNPRHVLRIGMVAEVDIESAARVRAITVPVGVIVRDPDGVSLVYVYFPNERRVYARRVTPGPVRGTEVEIRGGLDGSEPIVVAGQERLRDGMLVEIAGPEAAASSTLRR